MESGSRAWGFESKDSDYDVRFVYIRPLEWYMSISKRKDTLEVMINEELDFAGWDLNKALELLAKSNPPLGEWLNSGIVYTEKDNIISEFEKLFNKYLRESALVYHYLSMASKDMETLRKNREIKLKKYFNRGNIYGDFHDHLLIIFHFIKVYILITLNKSLY